MSGHTPGPWITEVYGKKNYVVGSDDKSVACITRQADMVLIAAAPDLLEALEWICKRQDWTGDNYPDLDWWGRAQKAIARAKGEL